MLILGIETSCDETAAAVVRDGRDVLSNVVFSQVARHRDFGGVVPEIASRAHVELLPSMIEQALEAAETEWSELDALAVTYGPGLASSLLVGLTAAKALVLRLNRPLLPVNHLQAHLYSVFLGPQAPNPDAATPMVVLLVTGGHTCLVLVKSVGNYVLLGQTLDDAAGEALDKGATLLGLGYPGGPAIEAAAQGGNAKAMAFPLGLGKGRSSTLIGGLERALCFSFSGLKTALLYYLKDHPNAATADGLKDVAASYQEAVFDALLNRAERAITREGVGHFACVGGVARNERLREKLKEMSDRLAVRVHLAQPEFCTDNAAMIAALAGGPCAPGPADITTLDVNPNLAVDA